jgi:hypothetical protein
MNGKTRLTRDPDHLYRIKPHERRWIYAGVTSDKRQVLMGLDCQNLVAIFFDKEGNLLDVQQRVLSFMVEDAERGVSRSRYDEKIMPRLLSWQEELGFQPATISVHKFFVLEERASPQEHAWQRDGIGIVDYPAYYHDAFAHPDAYTEEERQEVLSGKARWERDGQFVLWWGNDFWFDSTGECVAS